ncbi:hypothetical protein [Marinobacter sp. SS21]|uniref:hypothetical protein n=1 Tax=Marinobacter sp. SS21 TaxID=2979460 RepID=UPI00232D9F88|nr:hypothetical protein [Marinobacter sp. SS21]MDC0661292.1 hypothetical protein [Marinobacter sp. SS21]
MALSNHLRRLLLLLPLASSSVSADSLQLGTNWLYFDFREESPSGATLNQEQGDLPGVYLNWHRDLGRRFWLELDAGYNRGQVQYDGQTQAGVPLTTSTRQRLIHYDGRLGVHLESPTLTWRPYLMARYQRWDRSIQSSGLSLQLDEFYRWWEIGAGVAACAPAQTWFSNFCVDVAAFLTHSGNVRVAAAALPGGEPELSLGDGEGYRLQLHWSPPPWPEVNVSLFREAWDFGDGDEELTRLGRLLVRIREPASESVRQGIRVGLKF